MSKLSIKNKTILLGVISILLVIAIIFVSIELIRDINQNRLDKMVENKLYGTVSEVGKNYIKVKSIEDEEYLISSTDEAKIGDFIVIYYKSNDENLIENAEIEIIAGEDEVIIKTTETTTTIITTSKNMTSVVTTNSISNIVTTKTTVVSSKDDSVLDYIQEKYESIDTEEIKDKAKTGFITVVDFIFYDGEINGVTWDSIKTSTKAKVIYYALLMDSKIENKWPDYKENLKSKYDDIKSKLVAKYMDMTTSLCNEHPEECEATKNDFAVLKSSVGLTWDVIKSAFKFAYDKGVTYLVDWYEVYSGKR